MKGEMSALAVGDNRRKKSGGCIGVLFQLFKWKCLAKKKELLSPGICRFNLTFSEFFFMFMLQYVWTEHFLKVHVTSAFFYVTNKRNKPQWNASN